MLKKISEFIKKVIPHRKYNLSVEKVNNKKVLNDMISSLSHVFLTYLKHHFLTLPYLNLTTKNYIFYINIHHIIADGWSLSLFMNELSNLYNDSPEALNNEIYSYVTYANLQRKQNENYNDSLKYWKEKLKNISFDNSIPTDKNKPTINTHNGKSIHFHISSEKVSRLQEISKFHKISMFSILFGCFNILLSFYKNNNNIVVGVPHANRNKLNIENTIGYFVNILPILTSFSDSQDLLSIFKSIQKNTRQDFSHHNVPFEVLVDTLNPIRNSFMNPLFQILFTFLNNNKEYLSLKETNSKQELIRKTSSQFDLSLDFTLTNNQLQGFFEFSTDLFHDSTIILMIKRFKLILNKFIDHPTSIINEIDYVSTIEKSKNSKFW